LHSVVRRIQMAPSLESREVVYTPTTVLTRPLSLDDRGAVRHGVVDALDLSISAALVVAVSFFLTAALHDRLPSP